MTQDNLIPQRAFELFLENIPVQKYGLYAFFWSSLFKRSYIKGLSANMEGIEKVTHIFAPNQNK